MSDPDWLVKQRERIERARGGLVTMHPEMPGRLRRAEAGGGRA